tara:strand:+ start:2499 stop:3167 length:669 start_codon:yes stop_codon:yes gene_type:complete
MTLCIIPARSNSKRLPNKNILPFAGKPMVASVIENCKNSTVFSKIIVSSEDDEVLKIASAFDATPHKRSADLATDTASVVGVCTEVLKANECNVFCCVYPTSVLLTARTIEKSNKHFLQFSVESCSVMMGVSRFEFAPVQALVPKADGCWELLIKEFEKKKSQDFPETRVSNGTFYWAYKNNFIKEKTFYTRKLRVFDVDPEEVSDLNVQADYDKLLSKLSA